MERFYKIGIVLIIVMVVFVLFWAVWSFPHGNSDGNNNPVPFQQHYCYWDYLLNETDHLDTYYVPDEGNKYVVVTLRVVNNDSEPFSNNPYFWSLTVNRISYDTSFVTYLSDENAYESVEVQYGGTYTWKIVFEIPKKGTFLGGLEITYDTWYGPTMRFNPWLL